MKRLNLFIVMVILLVSCSNDNDEDITLIGKWELVARLADPGDGSGTFTPITSDQWIQFNDDQTVLSNVSLCQFGSNDTEGGEGTYAVEDSRIRPIGCDFDGTTIKFEQEGNSLILHYICIEGCSEMYRKI